MRSGLWGSIYQLPAICKRRLVSFLQYVSSLRHDSYVLSVTLSVTLSIPLVYLLLILLEVFDVSAFPGQTLA